MYLLVHFSFAFNSSEPCQHWEVPSQSFDISNSCRTSTDALTWQPKNPSSSLTKKTSLRGLRSFLIVGGRPLTLFLDEENLLFLLKLLNLFCWCCCACKFLCLLYRFLALNKLFLLLINCDCNNCPAQNVKTRIFKNIMTR